MSKNTPSMLSNGMTKANTKTKISAKGQEKSLNLDISKFDLKSPGTINALQNDPSALMIERNATIPGQKKSPRIKNNLMTIITDNLQPQETYHVYPKTTKPTGAGYLSFNPEKSKQIPNSNEKVRTVKTRSSQIKVSIPAYDPLMSKKSLPNKDLSRTDMTINLKGEKTKLMEEPPKKQSMPSNLALTSYYHNNHHMVSGSNSHRSPINTPNNDFIGINPKMSLYMQFHRNNSQRSDTEIDLPITQTMEKQSLPMTSFHNILSESALVSPKYLQGGAGGGSGLNKGKLFERERLPSPKEQSELSQNELMKLLNEKNKEILKLTNDKQELKSNLKSLNNDMGGLKEMKKLLKDKEKLIEELQSSLYEVAKDSDDLRREFQTENIISPDSMRESKLQGDHRSLKNVSKENLERIRGLVSQLKSLTEPSDRPTYTTQELKNNLLENIMRKNQLSHLKMTDSSYESFHLDKRDERTSQPINIVSNNSQLYQRNFSSNLEDKIGSKFASSPYYESQKNYIKSKATAEQRLETSDRKKMHSEDRATKMLGNSHVIIKKGGGDSFLGTPRKIQITNEKPDGNMQVYPNTTTAAGGEAISRKLLTDPKISLKTSTDFLHKKQYATEVGSTFAYTTEKEASTTESFNIGKGLNELKNRIAKMLSKHKDDHVKLKQTHDMFKQKLAELLEKKD